MKRLRLSREALNDLDSIWDYSAENWGAEQANRYIEDLWKTINGLPTGQTVSKGASDVANGLRRAMSGRHVIYFRERAEAFEVIRVLHQRMDVGRWI